MNNEGTVSSLDAMQLGNSSEASGKKGRLALIVFLVLIAFFALNLGLVVVFMRYGKKVHAIEREIKHEIGGKGGHKAHPRMNDDGKWVPTHPGNIASEVASAIGGMLPGGAYKPHPTQAHADALRGGPFLAGNPNGGLGSASKSGRSMDMSSVDGSDVVMGGRGSAVAQPTAAPAKPSSVAVGNGKTTSEELKALLSQGQKVVLGFFSENCGHCVKFKPTYQSAARNNGALAESGKAVILWVDANEESDMTRAFGVNAFPTVLKIVKDIAPIPFQGSRTVDDLLKFASS